MSQPAAAVREIAAESTQVTGFIQEMTAVADEQATNLWVGGK